MHRKKTFIFAILLSLSFCACAQSLPAAHPYYPEYKKLVESTKRFCDAFEQKKDSMLAAGEPEDNITVGSVLTNDEKGYIREPFLNVAARDTLMPWRLKYLADLEAAPLMSIRRLQVFGEDSECGEGVTSCYKAVWRGTEEIGDYTFHTVIDKADIICQEDDLAYYGIAMEFECEQDNPEVLFRIQVTFIDYSRPVDPDRHLRY
ncbi:MAG: hypothetical protein AAFP83_23320 [Bacteroidota bacterium]